jgi:hypothetical protein
MRLVEPVRDERGRLILSSSSILEEASIARLARVGVETVAVDDPRFEGLDFEPVVSDRLLRAAVELFAGWEAELAAGAPRPCVAEDDVRRLVADLGADDGFRPGQPVALLTPPCAERYLPLQAVNGARLALALAPGFDLGRLDLDVAAGAFVRDVGLLTLPPEARTPRDPLDRPEPGDGYGQHVERGLACLRNPGLWSPVSKAVLAQHHERLDGGGYPAGLRGEAIHRAGALVAAIDAYCALAVPWSPAGNPCTAEQALDGILSLAGFTLDVRAVQALCATVGLYAPGTVVRLSTGDEAVVLEAGRGTHRRPRLRLVDSGRTLDLQDEGALAVQVAAVVEP